MDQPDIPQEPSGDPVPGERPLDGARDPFGLVGSILERKYAVDRMVAEGGFGVVYRGHHLGLGAPVAVKLLKVAEPSHGVERANAVAWFVREAHNVARLRHPNVVGVIDAGECFLPKSGGTVPFIVFEWLDGPTLAEHLAAEGQPGDLQTALRLWRPICDAMAFAHRLRIVHRDLKPSNIIVQGGPDQPLPKVLDFGLSKPVEGSAASPDTTRTDSAHRAFSPNYAAPEQLAGTRTGPWTDVHALGLLLVHVLTGKQPYGEGEYDERYSRAFDAERPTPRRFGRDVGPLEAVLERALALRARARYQDAGQLLDAVDEALATALLDGSSVTPYTLAPRAEVRPPRVASRSRSPLRPEQQRRGLRRWDRALLGVGAGIVALAAGLQGLGWSSPASTPAESVAPEPAPPGGTATEPPLAADPPASSISIPDSPLQAAPPAAPSSRGRNTPRRPPTVAARSTPPRSSAIGPQKPEPVTGEAGQPGLAAPAPVPPPPARESVKTPGVPAPYLLE